MSHEGSNRRQPVKLAVALVAGAAIGMAVMGLIVVKAMPGMMIITEESALGFDDTVSTIEKAIVDQGWVVSGVSDMNKSLAKHGVTFKPRVKVVKLCKPEYAQRVLATDRFVSSLMPCSIAIWESDEGQVYISKMNTGLMGKMFGGTVAEVMGGSVAQDEHAILEGVLTAS